MGSWLVLDVCIPWSIRFPPAWGSCWRTRRCIKSSQPPPTWTWKERIFTSHSLQILKDRASVLPWWKSSSQLPPVSCRIQQWRHERFFGLFAPHEASSVIWKTVLSNQESHDLWLLHIPVIDHAYNSTIRLWATFYWLTHTQNYTSGNHVYLPFVFIMESIII